MSKISFKGYTPPLPPPRLDLNPLQSPNKSPAKPTTCVHKWCVLGPGFKANVMPDFSEKKLGLIVLEASLILSLNREEEKISKSLLYHQI